MFNSKNNDTSVEDCLSNELFIVPIQRLIFKQNIVVKTEFYISRFVSQQWSKKGKE